MSRPPILVVLALLIMVVVCSPSGSCAARSPPEEEAWGSHRQPDIKAGNPASKMATYSKATINPSQDCSSKYASLNYKPVTSICNPKVPATKACCAAFNTLACQYRSQVNNFNSICPIVFMSYLNYAGGYQDGYFVGKCIDGTTGLCV